MLLDLVQYATLIRLGRVSTQREKTVGILTKNEQVLNHVGACPDGSQFFVDPEGEDSDCAELALTLQMWEDFGRPTKITIAIEPGDKLNPETV